MHLRIKRTHPPGSTPRPRARVLIAFGVAAALGLAWAGCQVTPNNYKLLSFLFDGVPDPALAGPAGNTAGQDIRKSKTYSIHKPFEQEQCDACHAGGLQPTRQDSSRCLQCHADRTTEFAYMHGPVAAAACMWCHAPHESAFAHLLRDTDRKVCAQCHTPEMLSAEQVPEHADESRACLDCHTGHGGPAPRMLREGARAATAGQ
ncbi:MAG: hypothetical protein IT436_04755 [Phycisphaerales bacterium]|nr:hypothetical protein [Phycisphaerales bacterium]